MTARSDNPPAVPAADVLYGVAGWSYSDWGGLVYPKSAGGEAKLLTVASVFDLLEVNTSFYATPSAGLTAAWARRLARAGLQNRMVVKINRAFTHEPEYGQADVRDLREAIAPLDADPVIDRSGIEHPRLLGLLLQFPYSFRLTPENSQHVERLAEDFADWTRIIELRHASWARPAAYDWLKKAGFCLANIDLPSQRPGSRGGGPAGRSDAPPTEMQHAFPPTVAATGPVGYLRLHGRNAKAWFDRNAAVDQKYNYLYTPEELNDLADRIRELAGRVKTVAVVGNNHYRGKALATVLNLAHLVDGRRGIKVPPALLEEYPQLRAFAEPMEPIEPTEETPVGRRRKPAAKPKPPRPPKDDGGQLKLFD